MISKLAVTLLVITVGIVSVDHDAFGQTQRIGESPNGREYIGTELLDAYFGTYG